MLSPGYSCENPARLYKPQWAYPTPEGFVDELFLVPFQFTIPGDGSLVVGFPWSLDDDVPWLFRAIVFPELGTSLDAAGLPMGFPGLYRIRDTHGNPLSNNVPSNPRGLVLAHGVYSQSALLVGGIATNAFGFPLEPEIYCEPGGVLLFDFQVSTNALIAKLLKTDAPESIQFDANVFGVAGNGITVAIVNGGALGVVVAGQAVTITINTGVSTYQQVRDLIMNTPAARAVVTAQLIGAAPGTVITAMVATHLAGGAASSPMLLQGCLIGEKRLLECAA
jgi:hypothetical protein